MPRRLVVTAVVSVLVAVCLWSPPVPHGAAAPLSQRAAPGGSPVPARICVNGQTRCAPSVPLGAPVAPPASARLPVLLASGLAVVVLGIVAVLCRRRSGALARGVAAVFLRPPRLSTVA